jgi:hypothetical protein
MDHEPHETEEKKTQKIETKKEHRDNSCRERDEHGAEVGCVVIRLDGLH